MMPSWSNRLRISLLAALIVLATLGVFGFLSGASPAVAQGTLIAPTNVTAVSDAAGELTLAWEGGDNADSYLLIAVNLQDTADYKTATVLGDAAKAGTVVGLTSGGNHLGIVVALQATADGLATQYGAAKPVAVSEHPTRPAVDQPSCPMPGSMTAASPEPQPRATARGDYDADDDFLIDVANLQQLDAIRYDPRGRGTPTNQPRYEAAFPNAVAGMGCPLDWGCRGYELVADLDFDTNRNGQADAGDEYWNDGVGWLPIERYRDVLDGGGHTISNLYINSDDHHVGLFGNSSAIVIRVGLVSLDVSGGDFVGGLAGSAGEIIYSYATGNVSGRNNVGGLVGDGHDIRDSCADVDVSGEDNVGGLVGDGGYSFINTSYATGDVSGGSSVGGLVGHGSDISTSYAIGNVTGQGSRVGGLVGFGRVISDSYATGNVTSQGNLVGGLVGSGGGVISASYATGDVTSQGKGIGGLVGAVARDIRDSYATGDVTSQDNSVGGLVGYYSGGRNISDSYATGEVLGQHYVGGLVGYHACCGRNIRTSYATGNVSGEDFVGGLVGSAEAYAKVVNSYWDTDTSGQSRSAGGEGKTTVELQAPTGSTGIYAKWSSDRWDFGTFGQYPVLKSGGLSVASQR